MGSVYSSSVVPQLCSELIFRLIFCLSIDIFFLKQCLLNTDLLMKELHIFLSFTRLFTFVPSARMIHSRDLAASVHDVLVN